MFVKHYVGPDRRMKQAKKKHIERSRILTCRNCGDEFGKDGFCVKCRASLEMYRAIDNDRFAQFQARGAVA